jgi:hypothetical protein
VSRKRAIASIGALQHFSLKHLNRCVYPLSALQQKCARGRDVHIKELGMWSYTEAENAWLAPSPDTANPPARDDAPGRAA